MTVFTTDRYQGHFARVKSSFARCCVLVFFFTRHFPRVSSVYVEFRVRERFSVNRPSPYACPACESREKGLCDVCRVNVRDKSEAVKARLSTRVQKFNHARNLSLHTRRCVSIKSRSSVFCLRQLRQACARSAALDESARMKKFDGELSRAATLGQRTVHLPFSSARV